MAKRIDDHVHDATKYLLESLERSMFAPHYVKQSYDLKEFLSKLGIKSAKSSGSALQIESLEAVLKNVTFNHGKPDSLMINPKHLEQFKKLATKK